MASTSSASGNYVDSYEMSKATMDTKAEAIQLKDNLTHEYDRLKKSGLLSGRLTGNNVTAVLTKYLKNGEDFERAEDILRLAGFTIQSQPADVVPGQPLVRLNVYANSKTLLSGKFQYPNIEVVVRMSTDSLSEHKTIQAIEATIVVNSL